MDLSLLLSFCFIKQSNKVTSLEQVAENENTREQSSVNGRQEFVSIANNNHVPVSANLFQVEPSIENTLPPSQCTGNLSSDEYVLTELQPGNFQPPMCVPSSSQGEYQQNGRWLAELNEMHARNDIDQQEVEHNIFRDGEEEINGVSEIHSDIQQCLSLNRDYQVIIFFNIVLNLTSPLSPIFAEIAYCDKNMFFLDLNEGAKLRKCQDFLEQKKRQ